MRKCLFEGCTAEVEDSYPLDFCAAHREAPDERITAPMSLDELKEILGVTIKADDTNKVITFLAMLTAFTEDAQINVSFRAPSSTGKSYIPLEIASLFPKDDIIEIAYASPTAFFHDRGEWDAETGCLKINLERKIMIFVDMPHDSLLHRLRPLLSHDRKELIFKITDRSDKKGLRTKNVILRGYPSVVFCTASLKMDEQESTRNVLLSPETNQEKLRESVLLKIRKNADVKTYQDWLMSDSRREILKARVEQIRNAKIDNVIIPDTARIQERFLNRKLKPRDMRDVGRLMSIVKAVALLNFSHRERRGNDLVCSADDINTGFAVWGDIERSQDLGVPPYILRVFDEVIMPLAGNGGIQRKRIVSKHYEVYGKPLPDWLLRQQILPSLEAAGLVYQEVDPEDRRQLLIQVSPAPATHGISGSLENTVS
ncbi:MAG: hypothetical protein HYS81_01905 [Candidatus Aenigmatarchaeota archaeon]|nr:MAG: hypothetical protein HYS81_01905 [Candidatus Aenigmarchaeota archaeon]